jgi:DNA-binding CsgD family transcriptional regulator
MNLLPQPIVNETILLNRTDTSSLKRAIGANTFPQYRKAAKQEVGDIPAGLAAIEKLFLPWVIIQHTNTTNRIEYISSNGTSFFGCSLAALRLKSLNELMDRIHPEDQKQFFRVQQKMVEINKTITEVEKCQYRWIINYRFRKANGSYMHVQDEKLIIPNDRGHNLYFTLLKEISEEKAFTRVQLEWFKLDQGCYRRISSYVPNALDQAFTQRELEILKLIKEGLSSKKIANRLYISINTVRNHRSNLFKKTNAKNMIDLLNWSINETD